MVAKLYGIRELLFKMVIFIDKYLNNIRSGLYTDQKNNFIQSEFLWVKNSIYRHNIKDFLV